MTPDRAPESASPPRRRASAKGWALLVAALLWVAAVVPADAADLLAQGAAAFEAGNYEDAANAWRPLAEEGDAKAQFNMGLLHEAGLGVPEDAVQAAAWYERAALQGVTAAQYNLAVLLQEGRGVPEDAAQALYWLEVAALGGEGSEREQAADAAARLAETRPADEADAARTRARAFVPGGEPLPAAAESTLILSTTQVEELQRRLAAHGYDPGPADGVPGAQTHRAVRDYLADRGLDWPEGELLTQRLLDLVRAP